LLWYLHRQLDWQLGQGKLGLAYLQGYIWLRFSLDFLRIDRSQEWFGLGVNQLILVLAGVSILIWLVYKNRKTRLAAYWLVCVAATLLLFGLGSVILSGQRTTWLQALQSPQNSIGSTIARYLRMVPDRSLQQLVRDNQSFSVVVVNTNHSRQQGLSNTQQVPAQGMLFVFDQPNMYLFWMKDMQYPLDFIWLRDGKVVDLHEQVSPPASDSTENQLPKYAPKEPADMMLEVEAGTVQKDSWRVGDSIQLVRPPTQ
jgi:uncharacterized membrane protein (UPF0127 family)